MNRSSCRGLAFRLVDPLVGREPGRGLRLTVFFTVYTLISASSYAQESESVAPDLQRGDELPAYISSEIVKLFNAEQLSYVDDKGDNRIRFRLFVPAGEDRNERLPLIVWLHGKGESGDDNVSQLRGMDLIFDNPAQLPQKRFYLVATQCPSEDVPWYQDPGWPSESGERAAEPLAETRKVIDYLLQKYSIDVNRIYLSGVSSGGTACWEMAIRNPDLFAAVAPFASLGGDNSRVHKISNVPVWAFHSAGDSPELVRQTIAELQRRGGRCHLTEIPGASHNCWAAAIRDYGIIQWLLAQKKGVQNSLAPGSPPWGAHWRLLRAQYFSWDFVIPRLVPVVVLGICLAAYRGEIRRRERRRAAAR